MTRRSVVSLFSGALGLDLGLEQAGFRIRVAVECNKYAAETIRRNRPEIPVIERKLGEVTTEEILDVAGLRPGEPTLVTGGPSCQAFSTVGQRGSLRDPRGCMFREFLRIVREAEPEFFVMENVPGVLSAAVRHRPLKERGPGYPPLAADEELGSAFRVILRELACLDYLTVFDILTSADYGVPQVRKRALFLGSRDARPIRMPEPTHGENSNNGIRPWITLRDALRGLRVKENEYYGFPPSKLRMLRRIPEGGNWRDLPPRLQEEALGKAYVSWGGRVGFFRRLAWDRPSPALTTRPDSKATMFCHPDELRPLAISEYARIQTFPAGWEFAGPLRQQFVQAGNAVPVHLGRALGESVRSAMRSRKTVGVPKAVICRNRGVVERLAARPRTVLNPTRMRKRRGIDAAREWLGEENNRAELLRHLIVEDDGPVPVDTARELRLLRQKARRVTGRLEELYGSPRHGNHKNPLDELVFILLSQMTTGPSYGRVFSRLKSAVSSWDDVLTMPMRELKSVIKDAGLSHQKGPRLKQIFRAIIREFGELSLKDLRKMSDEEAEGFLCSLPGVGVKSAKCVLMYSLGREVLPVDTHVRRVAVCLGLLDDETPHARVHDEIEMVVAPRDRYGFHVNALAHGRAVCLARHPRCGECELRRACRAFSEKNR